MATLTTVHNGYYLGTAYYVDNDLYAHIHNGHEYATESVLLKVLKEHKIDHMEQLNIDSLFEDDNTYFSFQHPEKLEDLKNQLR